MAAIVDQYRSPADRPDGVRNRHWAAGAPWQPEDRGPYLDEQDVAAGGTPPPTARAQVVLPPPTTAGWTGRTGLSGGLDALRREIALSRRDPARRQGALFAGVWLDQIAGRLPPDGPVALPPSPATSGGRPYRARLIGEHVPVEREHEPGQFATWLARRIAYQRTRYLPHVTDGDRTALDRILNTDEPFALTDDRTSTRLWRSWRVNLPAHRPVGVELTPEAWEDKTW